MPDRDVLHTPAVGVGGWVRRSVLRQPEALPRGALPHRVSTLGLLLHTCYSLQPRHLGDFSHVTTQPGTPIAVPSAEAEAP
jgi:hypothetical protein